MTSQPSCSVLGCDRKYYAKTFCGLHYARSRRAPLTCTFPECDLPRSYPKLKCLAHFGVCRVAGCSRVAMTAAHRPMHRDRIKRTGEVGPAQPLRREWGTGTAWAISYEGYMVRAISVNGKRVTIKQHRTVMEEYLGRPLVGIENVHHLNGDRADNRIENLELWSRSQPPGQRVADKLAWAHELIAFYEGEAA